MGTMKTVLAAVGFSAALAAVPVRPCPAMSADDLTGASWNVSYSSRLRLPGNGGDRDTTSGSVKFESVGTFDAFEDDHGTDRNFPGTWRLSSSGKRLKWKLDSAGKAEVKDSVHDWLFDVASEGGVPVSRLVVRLPRITAHPAKLPASAGSFQAKLSATGHATATIGRERLSSAVLYNVNLTFSR